MILYIGNKLSGKGRNPTPIDTLSIQLGTFLKVVAVSDKKNKILRFIDMLWHIFIYHKKIDYIIIDTYSTLNFYYAFFCSQAARILKIPYIPFLHGGELPRRIKHSQFMSRMIFENAYMNVTPSHYLEEEFVKVGYKVTYIPNNIPVQNYPFKHRSVVKPKLLYVRALQNLYNPLMAIKVLFFVREKSGDGELCFVGPDKDNSMSKLKLYASNLGISQYITFKGQLTKKEWITLSAEYDIFINTTNADNMPVSIIEAMALGFPIVSTNVGGLPYLIKDKQNGLLVDANDSETMANYIISIISSPSLAESLSLKARQQAEEFDWEIVKQKWIKLLQ